nr:MAG TPA: hypothetical protein [Caudoviricetes sp.]
MKPEKQLYQWDVNQYLAELQPTAEFVDYPMGNEVIRIKADGTRCRIPDEVLQTYGGKTCYERYPDGTFRAYSFTVLYAPKPPDYIYTPEERTTFEALTARVDAAIEEIKRRADSGEFTPVKGVDYFTEAEKTELMEGVSSGAVGEFRKVVDTATAEYNDNHNLQLAKYNANASEKLTTYDANDEQRTSDYNRNAEQKLEAYNQNHTAKVAEYNENAAALQTEVGRLRGECDNLAAENRKQENRISALMKLNKGQTYDILPEEGESASRTAPSGAKYVSVDKVGGKSVVWNQLCNPDGFGVVGCKATENSGIVTLTETAWNNRYQAGKIAVVKNHKYYQTVKIKSDGTNPAGFQNYLFLPAMEKITSAEFTQLSVVTTATDNGESLVQLSGTEGADYQIVKNSFMLFDLTLMFGAGNEPTAEQFERMFPAESYPYNAGEIISSKTETITAGTEAITTGFPELRSALAAHDYIDMDGEKVHRKIKSTKIDGNTPIYSVRTDQDNCCRVVFTPESAPGIVISEEPTVATNIVADKLATITHNGYWSDKSYTGISAYPGYAAASMRLQDRTDLDTKDKVSEWLAENPMTVYYEAAPEEVTDVTIPEALTEWLPAERSPSGTATNRSN